jgi:hypothetical protein
MGLVCALLFAHCCPSIFPWHSPSSVCMPVCPALHDSTPCSPWPALDSMRGKLIVTLVLNGGTDMAARFQEAFPNLGACPPDSCQPAAVNSCLLHVAGRSLLLVNPPLALLLIGYTATTAHKHCRACLHSRPCRGLACLAGAERAHGAARRRLLQPGHLGHWGGAEHCPAS